MLRVRCKDCGVEITSSNKVQVCGCPNKMEVFEDKVTASDLSRVIMLNNDIRKEKDGFTEQDLQWQEQRRKRKVKRMDFEIR
tara:strand:- start:1036 stop:1281 length:246 start_codon:yes stop_codon:yes gene_type:complete